MNEGFASYMEYKGVANYHGDWEIKEQFLTSDLHRVLDLDATVNSHPIVQVSKKQSMELITWLKF